MAKFDFKRLKNADGTLASVNKKSAPESNVERMAAIVAPVADAKNDEKMRCAVGSCESIGQYVEIKHRQLTTWLCNDHMGYAVDGRS